MEEVEFESKIQFHYENNYGEKITHEFTQEDDEPLYELMNNFVRFLVAVRYSKESLKTYINEEEVEFED